jgi:hypothetical protein
MKKIILPVVALVVLAAIIAAAAYWELRPQIITLKDGTTLKLAGVTYGKHHVFKGIKTTGVSRHGRATLDSTNDTMVVWIESHRKGSNNQFGNNYQLFVYDMANTACVGTWQSTSSHVKAGTDIQAFTFGAFPRRDSKMILRVGSWGNGGGMKVVKGEFVISNPGPRTFTEWTPDPMPDTQSDGDLNVTLTKCVVGGGGFMFGGGDNTSSKDPMHKGIQVAFHTEQNGNVATNWEPVKIETSDATGNQTGMYSWSNDQHDTNGDAMMTYQWGLWPNEPAWKLHVEMSRTSGFTDAETWAVGNVPMHKGSWQDLWNFQGRRFGRFGNSQDNEQTNSVIAQGTINGIHLKVYPIIRITDQNWGDQHPGGLRVVLEPDLPAGYRLSAIITNEHGHRLLTWGPNGGGNNGSGSFSYVFQIQNLGEAQSLNVTLALHKSRFVDFTVKPTTQ